MGIINYSPWNKVNLLYYKQSEGFSFSCLTLWLNFNLIYVVEIDLIRRVTWSDNELKDSFLWIFNELNMCVLCKKLYKTFDCTNKVLTALFL